MTRKKGILGVTIHSEGKYFFDCLTRNYRRWLGIKRYGHKDGLNWRDWKYAEYGE